MKKQLDIIKKTIQILDSVHYDNYSEERASTFLEYMKGTRADEETLIEGVIFPKFAEQVLGFKLGESIWRQSSGQVTRGKPDFIPVDTRTHPFVFDIKGTDTVDLSKHYKDKRKYIEDNELKYLVLTNMRDLDVYTEEKAEEVEDYNFNFVQLYKDYKENIKFVLDKENTKGFLNFIERFRYQELTSDDKVRLIAEAKSWKGVAELNSELLTERLRAIVKILYEDIKNRRNELVQILESDPDKARKIAQEVELITSEMSRGREVKEAIPEMFQEILDAPETTLYGRALNSFFYRIAYFTMTRLLLARTWEDIGFILPSLYDGGFKKWYENYNREIRKVLKYAFDLAAERYKWLFNVDNNYSWYEPSDNALIESLYELSNFNLTGLNQDILCSIYEEYIEEIDKKNKGQYYTPREIVRFIWDRVGFTEDKQFFRYEAGRRKPKFIFDPATGSGGFLVEAVRRLIEESNINYEDFNNVLDIRTSILTGIFGSEISPFPYYITEVNLLIQLTPVIKRMMDMKRRFQAKGTPALGVIPVDSLSLYNLQQISLTEGLEQAEEKREVELLSLESHKKRIRDKIKTELAGKFDYCCANPPYVGEKGHKELFRETLRRFFYWKEYYQGKMDYLHWFVILGLSKLSDWGKLGFITTAYWPTAEGASKLRKYILKNAIIKEMIFFEGVKIFEHAKGQHNMVFILQKLTDSAKIDDKSSQEIRTENRIKIAQVKCENRDLPGKTIKENLAFLTQHISEHINKPKYEDEYIKVFWSGVRQGELPKDSGAWRFLFGSVMLKNVALLGDLCTIDTGIDAGVNTVTAKGIELLPTTTSAKIGDGIFVLTKKETNQYLSDLTYKEKERVKSIVGGNDLGNYIIDPLERRDLIYLTDNDTPKVYPNLISYLSNFRPILENRAEMKRNINRKWYALAWPRSDVNFEKPKIITPSRSNFNNFVLDEEGYYGLSGMFFLTKRTITSESLEYILGLLNSTFLNDFCRKNFKALGKNREYVKNSLRTIPIYRIDFNNPKEVKLHDKIVEKVKAIRERMNELANYSKYFKGVSLTKLEFDAPLPEVNDEAVIKELSPEKLYSLRTHPDIKIEKPKGVKDTSFYLGRIVKPTLILTGATELKLKAKDGSVLRLTGSYELIKLIAELLNDWKGESWAKIKEKLLIPESTEIYESYKTAILNEIKTLRTQIRQIQKYINKVVNKLYGLTEKEIKIIEGG